MLERLKIENYALISEVEIEFGKGLSIITGETGAGKSIMLGALGLLMGERVEIKAIADKTRKTVVEGIFTTARGEEVIARREISVSGRSRAFIDDSPVTLPKLAETVGALLDIHSQHANLSLNSREGQLRILDAVGDTWEILAEYRDLFGRYLALRGDLKRRFAAKSEHLRQLEETGTQLAELRKLKPRRGELAEVERRFEMLSDADEIVEHLGEAYKLTGGEDGAAAQLRNAVKELEALNMEALQPHVPPEENLVERLKKACTELKEIAADIMAIGNDVESNPMALFETGARMKVLYDAIHKYGVEDCDALVDKWEALEKRYAELEKGDVDTAKIEADMRRMVAKVRDKGELLSEARRKGALELAGELTRRAQPLGLPNLRFEVAVEEGKLGADGKDIVEFRCAFNKNSAMLPMAATASGGELARLTLAIKSIMAEKMEMPTVIFDEVDTGVSGEIADKMGAMMHDMAGKMQIITITHLPQVASKGERHYKVYKEDTEERTVSRVRELDKKERVAEIAGMISGERISDAALRTARELLRK